MDYMVTNHPRISGPGGHPGGRGGSFTLRFGDELLNRVLEPGWAYTRIQEETPVSHRQDEQALGGVGGGPAVRGR